MNPWPAALRTTPDGFVIGGVRVADLAARFGTPLLVFDEQEIRDKMRGVRARFPRVAYAVKAFTSRAVIELALEEGLDLLCASGGEVEACLRAGAPSERIQFHGNAKTDDELALAVRSGIGLVIADHVEELVRLDAVAGRLGRVQPVALRVLPEVDVDTHEKIATGHAASKFGIPLQEVVGAAQVAVDAAWLRLDGLQAHVGSQVLEIGSYVRVVDALIGSAARVREATGEAPSFLDVGGGFGVTYTDESPLPVDALAEALGSRLAAACADHGLDVPELQVEPGRAIVANPGFTLYTVVARKRVGGRTLLAVDGGMGDNPRSVLYDARFEVAPAGEVPASSTTPMTVVGHHCESGDVIAEDASLPDGLGPGDLLAVAATGAYTYPLASVYNRFGRPAVVAVAGDAASLWLRREDAADMDRLEVARPRPVDAEAPPGVVVRPARPADATSYLRLWRAVAAEERALRSEVVPTPAREMRRRFRRSWTNEDATLVAVEGARVVGFIVLSRERHPVSRHVATLGMAVDADRCRKGVGAALLAQAVRWARSVGVEKLLLSVYPHNTAAVSLYRRFGFGEEGRLSRQSRKSYGYEDEILMGLWLVPDDESRRSER